jgi:hypothetical protein
MFVLITEILDTFGRLVFDRIKNKGVVPAAAMKKPCLQVLFASSHSSVDLGPNDITEEARETCKNWFYKIASIRELLPRMFHPRVWVLTTQLH